MDSVISFFVSIVSTPAILVALIVCLGLVLLKKPTTDTVAGTLKTMVGFLVLTGGAGIISGALDPFAKMFQFGLHVQGVVPSNEAVVAIALVKYGSATALIMFVGMLVNILLARFTHFKYIYLTGQAMLYMSCLFAVILVAAGFSSYGWEIVILGGILEGTLLTILPALTQPYMRKITGNNEVAMGHTGSIGYALAGWVGQHFGNEKHSSEDIKFPKSLGFLRDSTVSIALVMSVIYIILAFLAGPNYVENKLSNGTNFIVYALVQAGTFTAGFVVVLQGVRMILAEIVPAFQGIATKLVPNAKPALDVPIIFPYAPNAVLIGFLVSFLVGVVSMFAMVGFHTTVIIPGVVGCFFCGGAAGVYGNSTGGIRGAILGSGITGLLIEWLPLMILPVLGNLKLASSTFGDTDYLIPGTIFGLIASNGKLAIIIAAIVFVGGVLIVSTILNKHEHSKNQTIMNDVPEK